MDVQDSDHKQLAGTIKDLHSHLRIQLRQANGDFARIWEEHCQNQELLSQYADAMHRLASDIWTKKPETRIHWCRSTCLEYFLKGGLEKLRQKDRRKLAYERLCRAEMQTLNVSEASTQFLSVEAAQENSHSEQLANGQRDSDHCLPVNWKGSEDSFSYLASPSETSSIEDDGRPVQTGHLINRQCICLPFTGKISLLDVGSCYNPFKEFQEFLAVGVDLCPAVESVHRCDFLQLEVFQQNSPKDDFIDSVTGPITSLPEESFHVVVFSLLLEYLPSPRQRWTCCKQAHRLLMGDGLLLIISPDSHHQLRNAPMMKSWKMAIESLGFSRWRYVKQEHLHCIAFRKTRHLADDSCDLGGAAATMLYIPQDLHVDEEKVKIETEQGLNSTLENEPNFMDDLNVIMLDD